MRVVMFVHSLRSCWNHGNAHFLRGVATELQARGHTVTIYEPRDGCPSRKAERFGAVGPGWTGVLSGAEKNQ